MSVFTVKSSAKKSAAETKKAQKKDASPTGSEASKQVSVKEACERGLDAEAFAESLYHPTRFREEYA